LKAELHSMLVYARGQFFAPHQDSEKDDAMVGSLVVGLPSVYKGGALQVRHQGRSRTYRGSKAALSFVAFYADCRHEVRPVSSGHRIVLTYNLLLEADAADAGSDLDPELVVGVSGCMEEHFAADGAPDRLVYLLDHEYTRQGLDASRLKGVDAGRAPYLWAAAERTGCEAALGLADVHETWSAYEQDDGLWGPSRRRRRWYDDDDEDEDDFGGSGGDYILEELIESEVTLDSWIDPAGGRAQKVGLSVPGVEVCASTPSAELEPHSSEYEGYMGNWGNTLEAGITAGRSSCGLEAQRSPCERSARRPGRLTSWRRAPASTTWRERARRPESSARSGCGPPVKSTRPGSFQRRCGRPARLTTRAWRGCCWRRFGWSS
jgi:hypothetical protein